MEYNVALLADADRPAKRHRGVVLVDATNAQVGGNEVVLANDATDFAAIADEDRVQAGRILAAEGDLSKVVRRR